MVLLSEVVEGEERYRLVISDVAQHEGHPPGVGEIAPVGPAGLAQLPGVVTEDKTTGSDGKGDRGPPLTCRKG